MITKMREAGKQSILRSRLLTLMRLALAVLTIALTSPLSAQSAKPNLTGKFELDPAASQGAGERRPQGRTLTIEHNEPKIRYVLATRTRGADRTQEFVLTTDGSDQVRDEPKGESRMSARWDGDVLEIRSFVKMQGGEADTVERWSLAQDGSLTVQTHFAQKPSGSDSKLQPVTRDLKLVYRKKS